MCWNMCSFGIMCQAVVVALIRKASASRAIYWLATLWPKRGICAISFVSTQLYAAAKNLANLSTARWCAVPAEKYFAVKMGSRGTRCRTWAARPLSVTVLLFFWDSLFRTAGVRLASLYSTSCSLYSCRISAQSKATRSLKARAGSSSASSTKICPAMSAPTPWSTA